MKIQTTSLLVGSLLVATHGSTTTPSSQRDDVPPFSIIGSCADVPSTVDGTIVIEADIICKKTKVDRSLRLDFVHSGPKVLIFPWEIGEASLLM